ncbi:hypothetical protein GLAREA_01436 [Glarea lozoyensis ATCC 20868]|uniref:Uncharacterized protein n=1 Tax=Glarea lozoyensis (strain ATCC 20868 / MF5171) TaxID=1116229 RepID=S3CJV8_GLAL2|nr:uncharacterized protein GLAREA_01436 [Glarea lozoyensis ATCC 20868]EPE25524.1 hypothetical protein GLAREA_01436 [Glarea lozoyensis ATCC 20868]
MSTPTEEPRTSGTGSNPNTHQGNSRNQRGERFESAAGSCSFGHVIYVEPPETVGFPDQPGGGRDQNGNINNDPVKGNDRLNNGNTCRRTRM